MQERKTMGRKDLYEVLGIDKASSESEIKSAYRKAAKQCHPDLHPDDIDAANRFKEVNDAYKTLSDKRKRNIYDKFGYEGLDAELGDDIDIDDFDGYEDLLEIFIRFNNESTIQNKPQCGEDIVYEAEISFDDAIFGSKKEITITTKLPCAACNGTGAMPGTSVRTCSLCSGTGEIRTQQSTMFGSFSSVMRCDTCRGKGKVIQRYCDECNGSGEKDFIQTLCVNFPAGTDTGDTFKFAGRGPAGQNGGEPGDIIIKARVKPHPIFARDGNDLYVSVIIPEELAKTGGEINVHTLKGIIPYYIPANTKTGAIFTMHGHGIKKDNTKTAGDLKITVTVQER